MEMRLNQLFSEPSGWENARVSILGSLAFFGIYAFFEIMYDSGSIATLVIGTAMGVSGVAELLPNRRRRTASALRLTGVGILVVLIAVNLSSLLT